MKIITASRVFIFFIFFYKERKVSYLPLFLKQLLLLASFVLILLVDLHTLVALNQDIVLEIGHLQSVLLDQMALLNEEHKK